MKTLPLAALCLVTLGIGFFLGRGSSPAAPVSTSTHRAEMARPPVTTTSSAPQPEIAPDFSVEALDALLAEPGDLRRRALLRKMFDTLPSDRYAQVYQTIAGTPRATAECLRAFFQSWRERDAGAAMPIAMTLLEGPNATLFRQLYTGWANRDLAAAKAFASQLPERERQNAQKMLDRLSTPQTSKPSPPSVNLRDQFWRHIRITNVGASFGDMEKVTLPALRRWVQSEPAAAAEEILKSPRMRRTEEFMAAIYEEWKVKDPSAAERFLSGLTLEEQQSVIIQIGLKMVDKDPAVARALAERLPEEGNWRAYALAKLGAHLASKDPTLAPGWIESIQTGNPQFLPMSIYAEWFKADPSAAINALIKDPAYQRQAPAERLISRFIDIYPWIEKDAPAAAKFISELPAADRKETLSKIGEKWIGTDANAAITWARSLPDPSAQDEALRQFTHTWAKHNAKDVTAHLDRLPQGSGKTAAIEGFAFASFDVDPDGVLAWIRVIPETEQRYDILKRSWRSWRSRNRRAAIDWFENVAQLQPAERAAIEDQ